MCIRDSYAVSEQFGIEDTLTRVARLPRMSRWDALARGAMRDDLYSAVESLARSVLSATDPEASVHERLTAWREANAPALHRANVALEGVREMETPGPVSYTHLDVYKRQSLPLSGSAT